MSQKEFSGTFKISEKTIQRYKQDELLNENISEGLIEIAEIIALGVEVLGRKLLVNVLGQIEHGIYA